MFKNTELVYEFSYFDVKSERLLEPSVATGDKRGFGVGGIRFEGVYIS
jgi:hypothetical protein